MLLPLLMLVAGFYCYGKDLALATQQATKTGGLLILEDQFTSVLGFSEVMAKVMNDRIMDYTGGTNNRDTMAANTLSVGTEPSSMKILHHTEMAYDSTVPSYVAFGCVTPNADGFGGTRFGSVRNITQFIREKGLEEKFKRLGVRYIRNFDGIETSNTYTTWQKQYDTELKADVEKRLEREGRNYMWSDRNKLRVWYTTEAYAHHPTTGEELFINSAYSNHANWFADFSPFNQLPEKDRPFTTAWGDGTIFSDDEYSLLEEAHVQALLPQVPWRLGTVAVVDNFLVNHGREAYKDLGRNLSFPLALSLLAAQRGKTVNRKCSGWKRLNIPCQ